MVVKMGKRKNKNMKKINIILAAIVFTAILTACGNTGSQSETLLEEAESKTALEADSEIASTSEQSAQNEPLWSGYIMDFADLDSMGESFRIDWQSQLGKAVYSYGGCRSDAWDVMSSPKNSEEELEFPFYFYTLDEFSIPTFHKTTAYGYVADHRAYIMSQTKESFDEIIDVSRAEELAEVMLEIFTYEFCLADYEEQDGNLATIISGLGLADGRMFDGKVDLSTPETAIADLLHYSGGTALSIPWNIYGNSRIVTYTFADGSGLSWHMAQDYECRSSNGLGTLWFPVGLCSEETLATAKRMQEYMTDVSAHYLRGITQKADINSKDWMTLPENGEGDLFVLLDEYNNAESFSGIDSESVQSDKGYKSDMAIYGLYGGQAIALRDGEDIYPIYVDWINPRMDSPVIRKADYDNDGTDEYALWLVSGTGTGFHQESLFMLEPDAGQETGLRAHEFTYADMHYQFAMIDYTFDEETNVLKVQTNAGSLEMDLTKYLETVDEEYEGLGWGDIVYIEEKDGQWYLTMHAGIMLSDYVQPDYSCGMVFSAPITYMENGYFQTGAVSAEAVYD